MMSKDDIGNENGIEIKIDTSDFRDVLTT